MEEMVVNLLNLVFGQIYGDTLEDVKHEQLALFIEKDLVEQYAAIVDFYYDNGWDSVELLSRDWNDATLAFHRDEGTFLLSLNFEVSRDREDFDPETEDEDEALEVVPGTIELDLDASFKVIGVSKQLHW